MRPEQLYASPNALAPFYSRFRVSERLLLTGHSHQAWPDQAFEGMQQAWQDAADAVDDKWECAFNKADCVRHGFAGLLNDRRGHYALAASTHDLVVRFLSALDLRKRPRIVTTDGEFHTIRRQLARLQEEGVDVVWVPATPLADLPQRLIDAVDDSTAALLVSSVFYATGQICADLGVVMQACQRSGCELLVDLYHHLNVIPFSITAAGLEQAYMVGGGYKYCQLGEGNCFLRLPADCNLRPVVTGWYADFAGLAHGATGRVAYGYGTERFAGATYDPVSHYRGAAVFEFFNRQQLTPELLHRVSQHQIELMAQRFDDLDLPPQLIDRDRQVPLEKIGGFLALNSPIATALSQKLKQRGVYSDARNDTLRLGPAPYLCDDQLNECMDLLGEVVRGYRI